MSQQTWDQVTNLRVSVVLPNYNGQNEGVNPGERFLDPSSYQFCTGPLILSYFRVRLGHFLGRALRIGQAWGPGAAATRSII